MVIWLTDSRKLLTTTAARLQVSTQTNITSNCQSWKLLPKCSYCTANKFQRNWAIFTLFTKYRRSDLKQCFALLSAASSTSRDEQTLLKVTKTQTSNVKWVSGNFKQVLLRRGDTTYLGSLDLALQVLQLKKGPLDCRACASYWSNNFSTFMQVTWATDRTFNWTFTDNL